MNKLFNIIFIGIAITRISYCMEKEDNKSQEQRIIKVKSNKESLAYQLIRATHQKDNERVKQLLREGANPYQLCETKKSISNALYIALWDKNITALPLFLNHPATNAQTLNQPMYYYDKDLKKPEYALRYAVCASDKLLGFLLDTKMMDLHLLTPLGDSALGTALRYKLKNSTMLLLDHIDNIAKLGDSCDFVYDIINEGDLYKDYKPHDPNFCKEIIPLLCQKGLSLNSQNGLKNTPLHQAIGQISVNTLKLQALKLAQTYPEWGKLTIFKSTVPIIVNSELSDQPVSGNLEEAIKQQESIIDRGYQVLSFLLNHDVNIKLRNSYNNTPAMMAAVLGRASIIEKIITTQPSYDIVYWLEAIYKAKAAECLSDVELDLQGISKQQVQALIDLLKRNNTKNAVKIMRRYITVRHIMSKPIIEKFQLPAEIAHIIAQYAITGLGKDYSPTEQEIENQIKLRNNNFINQIQKYIKSGNCKDLEKICPSQDSLHYFLSEEVKNDAGIGTEQWEMIVPEIIEMLVKDSRININAKKVGCTPHCISSDATTAYTPLHCLFKKMHTYLPRVTAILLNAGADINAQIESENAYDKETPLHTLLNCCQSQYFLGQDVAPELKQLEIDNYIKTIKLVLHHKPLLIPSSSGNNPLHAAAFMGNHEGLKLLLSSDLADLSRCLAQKNKWDFTPIEFLELRLNQGDIPDNRYFVPGTSFQKTKEVFEKFLLNQKN